MFGDKNIKPSLIVYGDSHAHMYLNSLDTLAKKKQLSFISFTHPACFSFENLTNYYKKNIRISTPRFCQTRWYGEIVWEILNYCLKAI